MLEAPQGFARVRQPPSLPLSASYASDLTQLRMASSSEKSYAIAQALKNEATTHVSAAATNLSGSSSVSSFLQGLWASSELSNADAVGLEGVQRPVLPSLISDVLAPRSFGAEPSSWPLQRLDHDVVNAAFQLKPTEETSSQITRSVPDFNEFLSASGLRTGPSRSSQSAVRPIPFV